MDSYTQVAMCRVSAYICVYVVPVKCEKYSLIGKILGENIYYAIFYSTD